MSWGHFKTVNVSVTIEIGIMEISKGSLEPVRGSKLPANVGKDMTADEVCVLPQENIQITINFFSDTKLVYLVPGTDEPFTVPKYKKQLGKPFLSL